MRLLTLISLLGAAVLATPSAAQVQCANGCAQMPPPPVARPGQCFAQVRSPIVYETVTDTVLVRPAQHQTRTIPACYQPEIHHELISPERTERHVIPAVTRDVVETQVLRPASVRYEDIPAVLETVNDRVMVRPAHSEWQTKYVGCCQNTGDGYASPPTGIIPCLVEYPA